MCPERAGSNSRTPLQPSLQKAGLQQIRNWKKDYGDHLESIEGPQYEAGAF